MANFVCQKLFSFQGLNKEKFSQKLLIRSEDDRSRIFDTRPEPKAQSFVNFGNPSAVLIVKWSASNIIF